MGMDDKKKVAIISLCSLLLVAAVVGTITMSVRKNAEKSEGAGANVGGPATSSKSVKAMCQPTDYKDVCEKSLAGAQNTSDPKTLIKVAFESTVTQIGNAIKDSALLQEAAKDPRTSKALNTCKELLNTSIDDIKRSFDKVGAFDATKMQEYVADLKTWISGAITYQETCLDGFENTTGDTGEKMKKLLETSTELSSNALAMVSELSTILTDLQIPGLAKRRLMSQDEYDEAAEMHAIEREDFPEFISTPRRKILQAGAANPPPNAIVSQTGGGQFKTINAAISSIPPKNNRTFVILIKAGVYKEYVEIPRRVNNVVLIGEGPTKTIITGNKNFIDGIGTYKTATVAVQGDDFIAKDIGFENSAGAMKHQAVALRVSGDKAVFYNCRMDGFQDTLYTHAYRQYYNNCTITGTIDFVFGDGSAVFQNCKFVVRKPLENQDCMVTAQGRKERRGVGGIIIQNSEITAEPAFLAMIPPRKAFLGRPWKEFSRTVIMQSYIDSVIAPEGWSPWAGTFGLDTLYFGEYQNRGPGANTALRVKWRGIQRITPQIADSFTVGKYLLGDTWIKQTGVPFTAGINKV